MYGVLAIRTGKGAGLHFDILSDAVTLRKNARNLLEGFVSAMKASPVFPFTPDG